MGEFLNLVLGLILLVGAGDALVRGAVALSLRLNVSAVMVSVTVVGFGTSAPELLIAVQAALAESPGIALGNVVGSNIANVLLVLGIPALVMPLAGCGPEAQRNLYVMLAVTALFSALALTGTIAWWAGLILIAAAATMVADSIQTARRAQTTLQFEPPEAVFAEAAEADHMSKLRTGAFILAGVIGLPLGAHLLIEGARGIAQAYGISEAAIGLTVVAVGTSLPELATSIMAAARKHSDVAIGNVIGSNIFNISAIAGAAALAHPLTVPQEILSRDLWCMIGASLLLTPFVLMRHRIGRLPAAAFVALYGAYGYFALAG